MTVGLLVLLGALAVVALGFGVGRTGGITFDPWGAVRALVAGDEGERLVVWRFRLPRIVLGALVGAALGLAGALFQTVLRNPLASPDILGVTGGAAVGAVVALLVVGAGWAGVALAALVGAAAVAALVTALAWRREDGVAPLRFLVVGIALAVMTRATVDFLLARSSVQQAQRALTWIVGSLGSVRWVEVALLAGALAVLVPAAALAARSLRTLELGAETAAGLGVHPGRVRSACLAVGVALAGLATAATGPVAFVAFVSAPVARRLVGGGRLSLAASALAGAVLVVASDIAGQHAVPGVQLPVGVPTALVGAPYLLHLLATDRGARR